MSWSKVANHKLQRPIGEDETFLAVMGRRRHTDGRENWAINVIVSLQAIGDWGETKMTDALTKAWKHLRFQQPSLAAIMINETTLEYTVPTPSALDEWCQESFKVIKDTSAEEVVAHNKPTAYSTLTYLPDSGEMLLTMAHWRTDGIGILLLLDALLQLASQPSTLSPETLAWGEETSRLSPSIEDAASLPAAPTPAILKTAQEYTETFYIFPQSVGIPYKQTRDSRPGSTRSLRSSLPESTTSSILARCHDQNLSFTAAAHASVAAATYALAPADRKPAPFSSTLRFGLRPYLREPYSGRDHGAAAYTTGWMKTVPASNSWMQNARAYNAAYRAGLSAEFVGAHRQYALNQAQMVREMPSEMGPSVLDISQLGVIEKYVSRRYGSEQGRGIEVRDFAMVVEIYGNCPIVYIWTFRGRVWFNMVYNEAYHEEEQMRRLLEEVERSLVEGLGVEG